MSHSLTSLLIALPGFAATAALRLALSPRWHRAIQRRLRARAIDEMERNLALFETTRTARKSSD